MISNKAKPSPDSVLAKYSGYIKFTSVAFLIFSLPDLFVVVRDTYIAYMFLESDPTQLIAEALETYNLLQPHRISIWCGIILSTLYALLEAGAGICGLCFHARPDKIKACIILGFLILAALLGTHICIMLSMPSGVTDILISLILPGAVLFFYLFGAIGLRRSSLQD